MNQQQFIAAIDHGTTSTRCVIYDHDRAVGFAQLEHRQILPRPGWVEHDPIEIFDATEWVVRSAVECAKITSGQIAAIGIANQRETTVIWSRSTGRPMHNAIVWQDVRTEEICQSLRSQFGDEYFRNLTGLPIATYFSLPKILWLMQNVLAVASAVHSRDAMIGTMDSWLVWKLTGAWVTDATNASRTMLMNLRTLRWDDALLKSLSIPIEVLPPIVPSSGISDQLVTRRDGAFGAAIPICGILGDQQAALVGQTCFLPGESKNTYGTGCFMLRNIGEEPTLSKHGLLTTVAYDFGRPHKPVYAIEGSVAVAGALVQWLRDNLGIIQSSDDIESLARSMPDNGGVYFVPAFSGLFAPYWRSDARGTIVGMTRQTNRAHIARAALEATAFQTRDIVDAMTSDSGVPLRSLRVDGGMCGNNLLMQFQSDILGVPVVRPRITETTALGAAYAAGLAIGYWKNLGELRSHWSADCEWTPTFDDATRAALYRRWHRAIDRSMHWMTSENR